MTYRVITVVFTRRKLTALVISQLKKYLFICEHDVKIGDMIDSPTYTIPCQVIDVAWQNSKPIDPQGRYLKTLIIDKINNKEIYSEEIDNIEIDNKEIIQSNNKTMNSMFSGIMSKYTGQFIPEKEDKVRMSLNGLLCVPQDDEYIGVQGDNLVSFPEEMTLPIPVYSIVKSNSAIVAGDIIKNGRSYSKVLNVNADGSLKIL